MPGNRTIERETAWNSVLKFAIAASLLACQEQSPNPPGSSSSSAVSSSGNSSSSSCIGGISGSILTDSRDCKQYKIVVLSPQGWLSDTSAETWMAENLNYADDDGNLGVCYGNDPSYCGLYGRLYYWGQAMNACPPGWRLPNNEDWRKLHASTFGYFRAKEGWADCGPPGSGRKHEYCLDPFGFAALPGGFAMYSDGDLNFRNAGHSTSWWSATKDKRKDYTAAFITFLSIDIYFWAGKPRGPTSNTKNKMSSVRCIKKKEV